MTAIVSSGESRRWFRLNNASTAFSLISGRRIPAVFRISADVDKTISIPMLEKALCSTIKRFPQFRQRLRTGFFWYFWEPFDRPPVLETESSFSNQVLPRKGQEHLFRVIAFRNRIAVEFNHTLTDGTGGMFFFQDILESYLQHTVMSASTDEKPVLESADFDYTPPVEPYRQYAYETVPQPFPFKDKAFVLPDKVMIDGAYKVISGSVPLKEILTLTRQKKVSITEFLAAVYIETLMDIQTSHGSQKAMLKQRLIRITIPVNMRPIVATKTLQNFFLYVAPQVDPRLGQYTFDEILKQIHHYMRSEVNHKFLNRQMKANVARQWNLPVRLIPLFIKKIITRFIYSYRETHYFSGMLSNLGRVKLPEAIAEHVKRIDFIPTPQLNKTGLGVVGYNDRLYLNFGRVVSDPIVARVFLRKLIKMGLAVKVTGR